jgi:hypothetical protein
MVQRRENLQRGDAGEPGAQALNSGALAQLRGGRRFAIIS